MSLRMKLRLTVMSVSSLRKAMVSITVPLDVRAFRWEFFLSNSLSRYDIVCWARVRTLYAWSSLSQVCPVPCRPSWANLSSSFITETHSPSYMAHQHTLLHKICRPSLLHEIHLTHFFCNGFRMTTLNFIAAVYWPWLTYVMSLMAAPLTVIKISHNGVG